MPRREGRTLSCMHTVQGQSVRIMSQTLCSHGKVLGIPAVRGITKIAEDRQFGINDWKRKTENETIRQARKEKTEKKRKADR